MIFLYRRVIRIEFGSAAKMGAQEKSIPQSRYDPEFSHGLLDLCKRGVRYGWEADALYPSLGYGWRDAKLA
jgi:hypothetical protein